MVTIRHGAYLTAAALESGARQCPVTVGGKRCTMPPGHHPLECRQVTDEASTPLGVAPLPSSVAFHDPTPDRPRSAAAVFPEGRNVADPSYDALMAEVPAEVPPADPMRTEPLVHPTVAEYARGLRFEDPPSR